MRFRMLQESPQSRQIAGFYQVIESDLSRSDFRAAVQSEANIVLPADRDVANYVCPGNIVEFECLVRQIFHRCYEHSDSAGAGFPIVRFLLNRFQPCLVSSYRQVSSSNSFPACILILRDTCVTGNGFLHQISDDRKLLRQSKLVGIQFLSFADCLLYQEEVGENLVAVCGYFMAIVLLSPVI